MNELSGIIETQVLQESDETLRELVAAFHNVGLKKPQIAFMLRHLADELDPPVFIHPAGNA